MATLPFNADGKDHGSGDPAGPLAPAPTPRAGGTRSTAKAVRSEKVWAAIGGLIVGYIGWLVAISIGAALTTAGLWSVIVMVLSLLLGIWAVLQGQRLRRQGNNTWAAFVFALPIPAVLMTLVVLRYTYL